MTETAATRARPFAAIPRELRERRQWVVWRRDGVDPKTRKLRKPPYRVDGRGRASSTDPSSWASFEEAVKVAENGFDGIGFALTEADEFALVDLDGVIGESGINRTAGTIVATLASYTERSQSGEGLHVLVRAELNGGRKRTKDTPWGDEIEFYDRKRFAYLTGDVLGEPLPIRPRQRQLDQVREFFWPSEPEEKPPAEVGVVNTLDDRELLDRAFAAGNGHRVEALYRGEANGYPSPSEADQALANHLAFWTGPDPERIERLMRGSGLVREKWDKHKTYLHDTIGKALEGRTEFYESRSAPDAGDRADARQGQEPSEPERVEVRLVSAEAFGSVDEPGAESVLGEDGEAVVPEGGDVMIYGDGGASKTTLGVDCAFHLGAGDDWLGIHVPKPVRVLLIEAEGPRPLFRSKIRAKVESWQGSDPGDRLLVMESPWASFRFPDAEEIAERVGEAEIDVLIVGPLTRVGMDELGTLQQVRDFMAEVAKFREQSGRRLTVILIHHENKGGAVSGAWEGAGDTLLHATVHARGKTKLHFQKTRWSSRWHKETLELDWTDGESFEPVEQAERDLLAEIVGWLRGNPHSTSKEIATEKRVDRPDGTVEKLKGIGANETAVRDLLEARQDVFRLRTGKDAKAVDRHPSARVWDVKDGVQAPPGSDGGGGLSDG